MDYKNFKQGQEMGKGCGDLSVVHCVIGEFTLLL